jgi:hypothetical protein
MSIYFNFLILSQTTIIIGRPTIVKYNPSDYYGEINACRNTQRLN